MVSNAALQCKWMTAAVLAVVVFTRVEIVEAAQFDCETMAFRLNPGDDYQFKLNIQDKTIRIEKGEDFCSEPAKKWFGRQLILPRPKQRIEPRRTESKSNAPLPLADRNDNPMPGSSPQPQPLLPDLGLPTESGGAVPLPIQREFVKTKSKDAAGEGDSQSGDASPPAPSEGDPDEKSKTHVSSDASTEVKTKTDAEVTGDLSGDTGAAGEDAATAAGVAAPPPPKKDMDLAKRCDREITMFWEPSEHIIDGRKYWLAGVFTIDLDGDGRVDDVGFKIKSKGRIGNILNYFPSTEGRHSGKTVDSLQLEDDRDIHRLCADNVTFKHPGDEEEEQRKATEVKSYTSDAAISQAAEAKANAEAEAQALAEAEAAAAEEAKNKKDVPTFVFVIAGISLVLLLAGGIGLALGFKNMTRSKDEDDEYEDDDEEDA